MSNEEPIRHWNGATDLHPQTAQTSRPIESLRWVGASVPHFSAVRAGLVEVLEALSTMPLREADPALFLAQTDRRAR